MKLMEAVTILHPTDLLYLHGMLLSIRDKVDKWNCVVDCREDVLDVTAKIKLLCGYHNVDYSIQTFVDKDSVEQGYAVLRNAGLSMVKPTSKVLMIDADERLETRFSAGALYNVPVALACIRSYHSKSVGEAEMVDGSAIRLYDRHLASHYHYSVHEELVFVDGFDKSHVDYMPKFILYHLGYDLEPADFQAKKLARIKAMSAILASDPSNLRIQQHLIKALSI